jgi:uncharacterized membrane protein
MPVLYLINGFVLSKLWAWFIVPLGAPSLTLPLAIGLAMVVGFLTYHTRVMPSSDTRTETEKVSDGLTVLAAGMVSPFITLLIGWLVVQFV